MQNYPAAGEIPMEDKRVYTAQCPVIVPMPEQKLNDDILFSTFNLHFCNPCCLGFVAFYNSVKVSNLNMLNNKSVLLLYRHLKVIIHFYVPGPGQQIAWRPHIGTVVRQQSSMPKYRFHHYLCLCYYYPHHRCCHSD